MAYNRQQQQQQQQHQQQQQQPSHPFSSHAAGLVGSTTDETPDKYSAIRSQMMPGAASPAHAQPANERRRRRRKSSTYAMNIDGPSPQQQQQQQQGYRSGGYGGYSSGNVSGYPSSGNAGYPNSGNAASRYPTSGNAASGYPNSGNATGGYPSSGNATGGYPSAGYSNTGYQGASAQGYGGNGRSDNYYTYATTTAQMVDPWAFNHASLMANLSQLPPDLLPTLLPQIQQQQQQNGMTALAVAAAAAAAATAVSMSDPSLVLPSIGSFSQTQPTIGGFSQVLPPMPPSLPQGPRSAFNDSRQMGQMPGAQAGAVYYGSRQPLMLPPPSPNILSYYNADPTQWMALLGQNAYQPQAYHYDYPLPPHQVAFNVPGQAGLLPSGGTGPSQAALLLAQQYAPVNNAAAAQMVAGQYPSLLDNQDGYQSARRASSYTDLSLMQQQPFGASYATGLGAKPSGAAQGFGASLVQQQQQQGHGLAANQPAQGHGFGANYASPMGSANMLSTFQQQTLLGAPPQLAAAAVAAAAAAAAASGRAAAGGSGVAGHSAGGVDRAEFYGSDASAAGHSTLANSAYGAPPHVSLAVGGTKPSSSSMMAATAMAPVDAVPGTRYSRQQARSSHVRDHILQAAHKLYAQDARSPVLIEMLLTLHGLHPKHLPTLLLLACAYFSSSQAEKSLEYNRRILAIDPNYVEAMSNIGTTLRSMGRAAEAEAWWWDAVKRRPGYWDAVENLMGVLCSTSKGSSGSSGSAQTTKPRYGDALKLCEFVDKSLCVSEQAAGGVRRYEVQPKQLHRLQSLLYSEGNLRFALGDVAGARADYERAVEVVLGGQRLDDVIVRVARMGSHEGINRQFHQQLGGALPAPGDLDPRHLPLTLLPPAAAVGCLVRLFPETRGVLPGFAALADPAGSSQTGQLAQANQVASNLLLTLAKLHQDHAVVAQPLSLVLPLYYLALALVPSPSTCNNLGIILSAIPSPPTPTMVPSLQGGQQPVQAPIGAALAMQYYSHGLTYDRSHPHLYTNLGSLLKDLGYLPEAVRMYEQAVHFNPTFDVALANLGNAIKDMGRVQDSVPWYLRAVQASPNFVEAVCGLANAMAGVCDWRARDGLYTEIAVRWRAVARQDDSASAIFHVMSRGKRPTAKEFLGKLRQMINYVAAPSPKASGAVDKRRGWMNRVVEIVDQQLSDGRQWARGILLAPSGDDRPARPTPAMVGFLDSLCALLPLSSASSGGSMTTGCPQSSLARFVHSTRELAREVSEDSELSDVTMRRWRVLERQMRSEGGWAMRLVERAVVVLQRQWYWAVELQNTAAVEALANPTQASEYQRPLLPTGMVAPLVPTVLPFHTFTYPLDAREIRLISHRNAMRLSFTTLGGGAPWLPAHVYPPPPPPAPHIRIGYVSSDFNNHPLSHLMQSVFGMHDRTRFHVYCYATTPPDGSEHRQKIEREADVFLNCSSWSTQRIVEQIAHDQIHVLVNLNGYTKGARNEIFAARPAPVLVAFMGFAGTLGAGWCDYVVTDPIVCPPWTVRAEVRAERQRRALGRQPEMREIRRSDAGSQEMARRNEMVEHTASMAISDASMAISDASSDAEDGLPSSQGSSLSRGARQREWRDELVWDFGELDPEEDGAFTGELASTAGLGRDAGSVDEAGVNDWVYTEQMIYMPHTYFVNDHKQGFREDEELRDVQSPEDLWLAEQDARYKMRREVFPHLGDDVFIFANFNQLYKIDPTLFRLWLQILERVPNSIIWLLRFPAAGEEHLHKVATEWAGPEVARRVVFTDVAAKHVHIKRGRVADAFLDTTECNAHTTAVDILWSGTPVLTWPRHQHKLCSRVAASVVCATGQGREMVVSSATAYVDRAVEWATSASHEYQFDYPQPGRPAILQPDPQTGYVKHRLCHGPTMDIRYQLFMARDQSRLFDTGRWTRNLERGYAEAWRRWVTGDDEASMDGASNTGDEDDGEARTLSTDARRKARWGRRIERQIGGAAAGKGQVYAPRGGSIWVLDEDDAMPSQTWVREMLGW
ncbi:hypothetical protein GGF46_004875 [Coemansia sp. RSA 552]|nr:hypothetical protein GGF46_004875 [Coemansia sp. RSA 552]